MPLINRATNEVTLKLVYYGPALAGKTTNLRWLHEHVKARTIGRLVSVAARADRTLFFDFVPLEPMAVQGLGPRVQLYAMPGLVSDETSLSMLLRACDAVVFVADSQEGELESNVLSLRSLRQNLLLNELDPGLPRVIQYNKRDLATALPLALLESQLNSEGSASFEAVAIDGTGIFETLSGVLALTFERLADGGRSARRGGGARADRPFLRPHAASAGGGSDSPEPAGSSAPTSGAPPAPPGEPAPDASGLKADEWLFLDQGRQRGPVSFDELVDLVLASTPEEARVFRRGFAGWLRADQVKAIAEEIPPPVPVFATTPGEVIDEEMPQFDELPAVFRSVLIADEDARFRRYLAMPLAAQRFTIYEAGSGEAAWQIAIRNRPWFVLADTSMPELDGFEFCRRLRSHPLLYRRPVVFISRSDNYRERHRALQIGADDFLSKDMPIRELLIRMQLLMTRYAELGTPQRPEEERAAATIGALAGQLESFGAPALVQICAEARLTGVLSVSGTESDPGAVIGFRDGEIVSARAGDVTRTEAVYMFLACQRGSFRFSPGDPGPSMPLMPTEELLLEGCRRIEESRSR